MAKKVSEKEIKEVEKEVEGETPPVSETPKVLKKSHPKFSKFSKFKGEK
jgi:hypothetical protein